MQKNSPHIKTNVFWFFITGVNLHFLIYLLHGGGQGLMHFCM